MKRAFSPLRPKSVASIADRAEFDNYYIENWSVSFDLKIMWMTLFRGVLQRQA